MPRQRREWTALVLLWIATGHLLGAATPLAARGVTDSLFEGFRNPPAEARPFVRWWWNGNCVTEKEVLRELDIMKAAGVGGIEINPISMPNGSQPTSAEPLVWLSTPWNQTVKAAVEGARQRGMIADLIVGTGWPFGGKFLSPDQTIQGITLNTLELTGPGTFQNTLPGILKPPKTPYEVQNKPEPRLLFLWLYPKDAQDLESGRDLMGRVGLDGTVEFDIPPGKHTLYVGTWQRSFRAVMWGAPGGDGPVLDHYNKKAVQKYLRRMSDKLDSVFGGRLGHGLRAMFCDSIELSGANWTGDLPAEFEKRRGYRLTGWLPLLLEKDDPKNDGPFADQVRRTRYDFSKTLVELFHERFLLPFHEWCHETGTLSRYQAYGHPWLMGMLDGYMVPDIPEGDTWLFSGWDPLDGIRYAVWNKYAASGAHLAGRSLIGCEAMTNTQGVFRATLESIKQATDLSAITGVNHFVLHGFNYSPPEAGFPGWVRYGTYFSEQNPWWPYFGKWADYCARLSWVLQQSRPRVQIAILGPTADVWSRHGLDRNPFVYSPSYLHFLWQAIHQNGCSADYVNRTILEKASFRGGRLQFGPMAYEALIVAGVDTLEPATAEALGRYAEAGGRILFAGQPPHRSAGMIDADERDNRVRQAIGSILDADSERIIQVAEPERNELLLWAGEILARLKIRPSAQISAPHERLFQIHHTLGEQDIFFLVNLARDEPLSFWARFDAKGTPWRWDPETGTRTVCSGPGRDGRMPIHLEPLESLLLVFEPERPSPSPEAAPAQSTDALTIGTAWKVTFEHAILDSETEQTLTTLTDLSQMQEPRLQTFAGTATYRTEFEIPDTRWNLLDLGNVHDISEVTLNGKPLGVRWWGRHRYDAGEALQPGRNTLEVRVTNTAFNYCRSLGDNPTATRWTKGREPLPTGLVGPVRLRKME